MYQHAPVLLREALDGLQVRPGGRYVDGTLGGGGHSAAILERGGEVWGIDRDMDAISAATGRLSKFAGFHAVHGNFHDMKTLLHAQGIDAVDGILLDLGVSSHQLDVPDRGFSYHAQAPLDMRMDQSQAFTAEALVNTWPAERIADALYTYGDEKWAKRVAAVLVEHREKAPLKTTGDLVRVVDAAIPRKVRDRDAGHSAQKTFQAIRIAVNDELAPLSNAIEDAISLLVPGGLLCVISFHSIEDRIVKQTMRALEKPCTCPPGLPVCICGKEASVRLPVRGAIAPGSLEIAENPRARSAKLRIAQRL